MLLLKKKSIKYVLWPFLVFCDLLLQYVWFKLFRRNRILLLDRYPYDHYMSFKYLGTLTNFAGWLFLHFPKPDAIIVLTVDPEVAYERKKETHSYSISFYEEQTESYIKLANRLDIATIN